jgi:hypothetical protein
MNTIDQNLLRDALLNLSPTGASSATTKPPIGVIGSEREAAGDIIRLNRLRLKIEDAALNNGVLPCVLAGIASRETHAGLLLNKAGFGDNGHAFGVMQVDRRYNKVVAGLHEPRGWESTDHFSQSAHILRSYYDSVAEKHVEWTVAMWLQGAVAAYKSGVGNVDTWKHLDAGTTHNDYSNDVMARARFIYRQWNK